MGDSTDGAGFLDALRGDDGFDPTGRRCLILGAGGAARSVSLALAEAGAGPGRVVARRRDAAGGVRRPGRRGWAGAAVGTGEDRGRRRVKDADLIVNATPVGMAPGDGLPFGLDPASCAPISSSPTSSTPRPPRRWWRAAPGRGRRHRQRPGLLIHQAARQVAIWTGRPAPIDVMSAAAPRRPARTAPADTAG